MPSIGDMLFNFTEWLRSTQLPQFALDLQSGSVSTAIATHFWVIPIMQVIHILAVSAAFGSVLMVNLRVLGVTGMSRTMTQTVRRFLPWTWWALLFLTVTGIGMIIGEPPRELINPILWIKLGLVILLVLISIGFQASVRRNMAQWEMTHDGRVAVRFGSVGIIVLWCVIMAAGRWIAYAPV